MGIEKNRIFCPFSPLFGPFFHFSRPHSGHGFQGGFRPRFCSLASCAAPPLRASNRSPYRFTMDVLFHLPACRIAGNSIPDAIMSCTAPTRVLWPDSPATMSFPNPAFFAMDL